MDNALNITSTIMASMLKTWRQFTCQKTPKRAGFCTSIIISNFTTTPHSILYPAAAFATANPPSHPVVNPDKPQNGNLDQRLVPSSSKIRCYLVYQLSRSLH